MYSMEAAVSLAGLEPKIEWLCCLFIFYWRVMASDDMAEI